MAGFYAIILDWHYESGGNTLELIESGATLAALRDMDEYDPSQDCSRVIRNRFEVERREERPIRNVFTGNVNPAHIFHLVAK